MRGSEGLPVAGFERLRPTQVPRRGLLFDEGDRAGIGDAHAKSP